MRMLIALVLVFSISYTFLAHSEVKEGMINQVSYRYLITEVDSLKIVRLDEKGNAIHSFHDLSQYYDRHEKDYYAAMNGSIFEPDRKPTGLLIQDGKTLSPLNLKDGYGNFFLKPNGVFYLTKDKARVIDSQHYEQSVIEEDVLYATQSGPLLLSDGKIHPRFKQGSDSRKLRNGVGILDDGRVIIAISDKDSTKAPNLFEFASFFLSKGCKNALYLDGTISEFREKDDKPKEKQKFSSFLVVEKKVVASGSE